MGTHRLEPRNESFFPKIKILNIYSRSVTFGKTTKITMTKTIWKEKVEERVVMGRITEKA